MNYLLSTFFTPMMKDRSFLKKVLFSVVFSLFFASLSAQEIEPDSLQVSGDTIAFLTEFELENERLWKGSHPADSLYFGSWNTEKVNPYKVKIDSLPDSLCFVCKEYVHPIESTRITSNFGLRRYRFHYGIDIGLNVGDTVRSVFDGQVRILDYEKNGYGRYLVVRHSNGLETVYAHLSKSFMQINDIVKAGQPIALGGNTGRSTGPHLHFEIRFLGNAINPLKIIDFGERQIRNEDFLMVKTEAYDHKSILDELAKARYCTVRSGDTLSGLAHRYGTTVSKLCKLNRISSKSIIRIGQKIRWR